MLTFNQPSHHQLNNWNEQIFIKIIKVFYSVGLKQECSTTQSTTLYQGGILNCICMMTQEIIRFKDMIPI